MISTVSANDTEAFNLAKTSLQSSAGNGVVVQQNAQGYASFISVPVARTRAFGANALGADVRAQHFLNQYKDLLVKQNTVLDLRVTRKSTADVNGYTQSHQQQLYLGIPVAGTYANVSMTAAGISSVNTHLVADFKELAVTPVITARAALETARRLALRTHGPADLNFSNPQLQILDKSVFSARANSHPKLTWFIEVTGSGARELLWIDAVTGSVSKRVNQLTTAKNRQTYNSANQDNVLPGTLERSEGQGPVTSGDISGDTNPAAAASDVNDAHDYAGDTYDFYFSRFGRDSYDGVGATITSSVRVCGSDFDSTCPDMQNAFWNGTQMAYGSGFSAADDVVAHELTHAVTQNTADLIYQDESGALNESYSDIFGEAVDLSNAGGTDTPTLRWSMGEDIPGIGAIRNMQDPTIFGDPDKVTSANYFCGSSDNGGVHSNSGVPNHAFALMVDGGSFNGQTVTGIGLDKASAIQYRTLSSKLGQSSSMLDN